MELTITANGPAYPTAAGPFAPRSTPASITISYRDGAEWAPAAVEILTGKFAVYAADLIRVTIGDAADDELRDTRAALDAAEQLAEARLVELHGYEVGQDLAVGAEPEEVPQS